MKRFEALASDGIRTHALIRAADLKSASLTNSDTDAEITHGGGRTHNLPLTPLKKQVLS